MHKLLMRAVEQHYSKDSTETVSNVQLLYYIQLILILFLLTTVVIVFFFTPADNFPTYASISLVTLAILCVSAFLNLMGHYRTSLIITVTLMFAGPWVSVAYEYSMHSGDFVPLLYTIIPLQISALFFSTRAIFAIAASQTILLSLMIVSDSNRNAYNWESFICFIFVASMLGTITSYVLRKQYRKVLASQNSLATSERMLRDVSIHDPLSGLYNRRFMDETFRLLTHNPASVFCLMMVDVDHFKVINDTYGHSCGDAIIQRVADILTSSIRKNDIACRYGGDEFLLFLPGCNSTDALDKAARIMKAIGSIPDDLDLEGEVIITASIGIAQYPENGNNRDAILKAVDDALYLAKQEGRDRIITANGEYQASEKASEKDERRSEISDLQMNVSTETVKSVPIEPIRDS